MIFAPSCDLDTRPFGDVVVGEDVAFGVLDQDLRVQVALVLHDRPSGVARGVDLDPHRLALDDVFEADLAADFGEDRDVVRVPLAEHGASRDHRAVFDFHLGTVGNVVFFQFPAFRVEDLDFAVPREGDLLALVVDDEVDAEVFDLAIALRLDVLLFDTTSGHAADVEGSHRELRAWLADRLSGDDSNRHPRLDELAGGEVHPVAAPADAERGFAGHRAADLDLLDLHLVELLGSLDGDHLVLANDDLVGDRVDDIHPAHPAPDRLDEADLDLFALVHDPLRDPLRRSAVFHRDHDVLGDVGEFSGQIAGVGRLEGGVGETFPGSVRRGEVLEHREAFAEVGFDRRLDDPARGLGHKASHSGKLADLLDTAAGSRVGHQEHRVQVDLAVRTSLRSCSIISAVIFSRAWVQWSRTWLYRSCSVMIPRW